MTSSQPISLCAVTDRRKRRWTVIVVLASLVALFALRAVVHHIAHDATSAAANTAHHEGADDRIGLDIAGTVTGVLLLAGFLAATRVGGSTPRIWMVVMRRLRRPREPLPPGRFVPGAPTRAELQCFLT